MAARRHRRGAGSTYPSQGAWIARIRGEDGKIHRGRYPTPEAAERGLAKLRERYSRPDAREALGRYLDRWFAQHRANVRDSTADHIRGLIDTHIEPSIGGITLAELHQSDVRRLIAEMQAKGKAPGTIVNAVRTLSGALQVAVDDGTLPVNVARRVQLPRTEREPVPALTYADVERIIAAVSGTWLELPVRVYLGSGLRRGEVLGLDQRDLVLEEGYIRVRVSKSRVRAVPITEDAVDALREAVRLAPRRGPKEPVFFGVKTGERLGGDTVTQVFARTMERAGLGRLTIHSLRHGVATLMVASGVHIRTVAEQLGHANPSLTLRTYSHISPDLARQAIRSVERRKVT